MGERQKKTGFRAVLAHTDFRWLVASLTTSGIGDWFYNVALIVYVLEQTGSPGWVAAASICRLLPFVLFGSLGGVLGDRYDRRTVMIMSDLARAALMFLLTLVAVLSAPVIFAIALAFLSTVATTAFFPAAAATTPSLVEEDTLAAANGLVTTIDYLAIALGPALGGLVIAVGGVPALSFGVNGLTFVASALFLARLPSGGEVQREKHKQGGRTPLRRQLAEGAEALTSSGSVVILVAIIVAATFTYGEETVLYPLVAGRLLSTGTEGVGYLFAAVGVGGVLASGVANRVVDRARPGVILVLGSLVSATPLLLLPLTTTPAVAYLLVAIEGGSFIFVEVLATTLLQRIVRTDVMARVFGIIDSLTVAGTVLGAFVAPVVVRLLGLQAGLWTAGGILIVLTLLCIPRIRVLDKEAARRRQELGPRITVLSGLNIFAGMPRGSLESLAAVTEEESVTSGEIVIAQGAPADDFFVVRSGALEVLSSGEGGGAQAKIRELGEGDYAGEIGLVERLPRTATVRATSDCSLYRIKGDDFLSAVNGTPALSGALFAGIAGRLARTHPSYQPKARPPD